MGADNRNYNDGMGDMQGYRTMPNFKWFRLAVVSIVMIISTIALVFLGHFVSSKNQPTRPLTVPASVPPPAVIEPTTENPMPRVPERFDYKLITSTHLGYQAAETHANQFATKGIESYIWEVNQADPPLYAIQLGAYPTRSDCDSQVLRLKKTGILARCWHPADGFDGFHVDKPKPTTYYKVILGAFPNYAAAQAASAGLSPYIWENNGIYVAQVGAYSTENESQAAVEKLAKRGIISYVWQERDGFDAIRNRAVSTPPPKQNYHVVMGVFKTQELAKQKASSIASITNYIIWENALGDKTVYRILLGSYTSKADAKTKQQELNTQGIQSFVIFE